MLKHLRFLAAAIPLLAAGLAYGEISGSKHDFSINGNEAWSDNQICKPCHTPHNADVSITGRIWAHTLSTATYKYHGARVTPGDASTSGDGTITGVLQDRFDGATRLCLSCHDGTVALDSFKGKEGGFGTTSINTLASADGSYNPNLGGVAVGASEADLSNDHPVGFNAQINDSKGRWINATTFELFYKPSAQIYTALGKKLAKTTAATDAIKQITAFDGVTKVDAKDATTGAVLTGTQGYSVSCVSCHDVHNAGAPDERGLLRISNEGSALCLTCHNK